MFEYKIVAQDGNARVGEFTTPHGTVMTPMFMPVGTHGAVKGVMPHELKDCGSQTILANTYHMYLRPGEDLVQAHGSLHGFMQWDGPILTDSGGFQVFSLGDRGMKGNERQALRQVTEDGVRFQSHLDGSYHLFTPEKSVEVQQALGADIIMAFDQPVYGLSDKNTVRVARERTSRWLTRSIEQWRRGDINRQALFGIVQGGIHTDEHIKSAEFVTSQDLLGNAIGGLSVGEGKDEMWKAVDSICSMLPQEKPRYFMGLGEPLDLIEATMRGVDMYDCVSPTRLARHGSVWHVEGEDEQERAFWEGDTQSLLNRTSKLHFVRWNLHNAKFKDDVKPLVEHEAGFSRAVLAHYVKENEMVGFRELSIHNIRVLHVITEHLRSGIAMGRATQLREILV